MTTQTPKTGTLQYINTALLTVILSGIGYTINLIEGINKRLNETTERVIKVEIEQTYAKERCRQSDDHFKIIDSKINIIEAVLEEKNYHLTKNNEKNN